MSKEHLTISGLNRIVRLKSALNKDLSDDLMKKFPNLIKIPLIEISIESLNPHWVSGFTEGDGSFFVSISKKTNTHQVKMFYSIKLRVREVPLILRIQEYFNEKGSVIYDKKNNMVQYKIASIKDINEVIIPQFDTF